MQHLNVAPTVMVQPATPAAPVITLQPAAPAAPVINVEPAPVTIEPASDTSSSTPAPRNPARGT
jgi:hypothetical protein